MKGLFITFYGVNNLGKTTQAKMLVKALTDIGREAEYLKYPLYDLEPTGPIINSYLREGNPHKLTPLAVQLLYIANRAHYEQTLKRKLDQGIWIIAEDYTGTGIAWGAASGIDRRYLIEANSILLTPDVSFLFSGERFAGSIEAGHRHENDTELTIKVAKVHYE